MGQSSNYQTPSYGKGGGNAPAPAYASPGSAQDAYGAMNSAQAQMGGGGGKGGGNAPAPDYAPKQQAMMDSQQGMMGGGGGKGGNANAPFYDKLAGFAQQQQGGGAGAWGQRPQMYQPARGPQYSQADMQRGAGQPQAMQNMSQADMQRSQLPQQGQIAGQQQAQMAQMLRSAPGPAPAAQPGAGYQSTPINNFAPPADTSVSKERNAALAANMDYSGFRDMPQAELNRQINYSSVGGAGYDPEEQARQRTIAENTPGSPFYNPYKFGGGLK